MHNLIIQISSAPFSKDEYIDSLSLSDAQLGYIWADYINDDIEDDKSIINQLSYTIPSNLITIDMDNRCIHVSGTKEQFKAFISQHIEKIKQQAEAIQSSDFSMDMYKLKNLCTRHNDSHTVFYVDGELMFNLEFIQYMYNYYINKTLYIGAALDYHW